MLFKRKGLLPQKEERLSSVVLATGQCGYSGGDGVSSVWES